MKRVFFLAALAAAGSAGLAAAPDRKPVPAEASDIPLCKPGFGLRPARRAAPVRVRPLIDEPKADLLYAVILKRGGCIEPVIVREDVGAGGR
jgi:hypothetical protein